MKSLIGQGYMRMLNKFLILALLVSPCSSALAQNDVIPVYVRSLCSDDPVGNRISFKVREGVRKSSAMRLVESPEDAVFKMSLKCIEPKHNEGYASDFSYTLTATNLDGYYDYAIKYGVRSCGSSRVDECADGLVADMDTAIIEALKHFDVKVF